VIGTGRFYQLTATKFDLPPPRRTTGPKLSPGPARGGEIAAESRDIKRFCSSSFMNMLPPRAAPLTGAEVARLRRPERVESLGVI